MLTHPSSGLFLDMGLGKTVITLTAIAELVHNRFDVRKVLVIAPLRVAQTTWSAEIEKWDHTRRLRYAKVLGSPDARKRALEQDADIYIVNRENVDWLVDQYGKAWPFDMVVVDELSSFKSARARRFRALRRVRPRIRRVVGLTGTPAPNGLIDLWAQLYLLDGGERLGKTVTGYRDRYFVPDRRNRTVVFSYRPKPEAERAIYERIGDICISLSAADWLDMPERLDRVVPVTLAADARRSYDRLERDLLLPLSGADVVADTAAALSNKLLQMANGAVYDEHQDVQHIHDAKLDALEDIVEAAYGRSLLVYYTYRHDLDRIRQRFPQAKTLNGPEDVRAWNAGETELLVAHPAAAGHGLNLQDGGHHVVWFGLTWSLELYQQANARLHRQGQRHPVVVQHLVVTDTMDEMVMAALSTKDASQAALLAAVKARLEKVVGRMS